MYDWAGVSMSHALQLSRDPAGLHARLVRHPTKQGTSSLTPQLTILDRKKRDQGNISNSCFGYICAITTVRIGRSVYVDMGAQLSNLVTAMFVAES